MLGLAHDVNALRATARVRARHVDYVERIEREACADKNSRRGFRLVPRYLELGQRLLSERRRRGNREVRGEIVSDSPHQNKGGVGPLARNGLAQAPVPIPAPGPYPVPLPSPSQIEQLLDVLFKVVDLGLDTAEDLIDKAREPPPKVFWYHYTTASEREFLRGVRSETWVTDVGTYTSQEASAKLGIRPPSKVIIIQASPGEFVPGKPPVVPPNKYGPGGGRQYYNPIRLPGDRVIGSRPLLPIP